MRAYRARSPARPDAVWALLAHPARWSEFHRVEPYDSGSLITIELEAPGPLEPALAATYGPLVQLLLRRLASVSAAATAR